MNEIELFNRVCDNLCVHSEINTGKECELKSDCPLSDLINSKEPETYIKEYVESMKHNIELANNTYTVMGYEIALDVLKGALEENGYDTSFMEEQEEEDV